MENNMSKVETTNLHFGAEKTSAVAALQNFVANTRFYHCRP